MLTKQRCPKCNQYNEPAALRCAHCKAPLVQTCPRCGASRPWYVQRCPQCDTLPDDMADFADLFRGPPTERLHGRYLIHETVASGRVSAVYRAVDVSAPQAPVAIKEFSTVALFRPEERREAATAFKAAVTRWSRIAHPSLPRLVETFSEREKHYVVSEFVEGLSLKRIISEGRIRVSPDLVRNWGAQLCQLLQCLHGADPPLYVPFLTPGHVIVSPRGEVRVVDLGLTYLFSPGDYGPYGSIRGYAAPELADGSPTPQSDVFALGRILYASLIGQMLETTSRKAIPLHQAVRGISSQLVKAIAQAAHRDPARRYASAADFGRALWDEMLGPLQPVANWAQTAPQTIWAAPVVSSAQRIASDEPSMADLGYERDARFGSPPPQATPTPPQLDTRARLSVYPHSIDLTDLQPQGVRRVVLTLRNVGEGELAGQVISHVDWLSAPRQVIRLPANRQAKVVLSLRAALLPAGRLTEPQAISIETNGGRQWVGVTAEIVSGPLLRLEQTVLDYGTFQGEDDRTLSLTVANDGRQILSGSVTSRVPWLQVRRGDVRCAPGQDARVAVTLVASRLPRGAQDAEDALVVDSDGGQERVGARAWRTVPVLDLGATHMDFGAVTAGETAERYLYVHNAGDGLLEGTALSLVPWLRVHPQQIVCAAGEMVQLQVSADSAGLPDGSVDIPQSLRVQTNAGTQALALRMHISAPRLVLDTSRLEYGPVLLGESREQTLAIRNDGSAPLMATVQSLADWLVVAETEILVGPGQQVRLSVRADTRRFSRGQEIALPSALRILAPNAIAEVPASITVVQPALRVEPVALDFGYIERSQPETRAFLVANDGTGKLAWNAQTDALWLEIAPSSGVCAAGESQSVALIAYGLALETGDESASAVLVINSDGGRAKIPLRVALAAPRLATDTTLLDLGTSINRRNVASSFRVFNHGLGLLRGSVSADCTWLVLGRASFECATGRSVEVPVNTDMEEFPADTLYGSALIAIESNGGSSELQATLSVFLSAHIVASKVVHLVRPAEEPPQGRLNIKNAGLAMAHVALRPNTPQLVLSRSLCDIKPGKSVRIAVHWEGPVPDEREQPGLDVVSADQHLHVPVYLGSGTWGNSTEEADEAL